MFFSQFSGLPTPGSAHVGPVAVPSTSGGVLLTTLFTLSAQTQFVKIQVETADIRMTINGTAPTSTLGFLLPFTGTAIILLSREEALAAKVIQMAANATVQIGQYSS